MFKSHFWKFCGALNFGNFDNFVDKKLPIEKQKYLIASFGNFESPLLPKMVALGI